MKHSLEYRHWACCFLYNPLLTSYSCSDIVILLSVTCLAVLDSGSKGEEDGLSDVLTFEEHVLLLGSRPTHSRTIHWYRFSGSSVGRILGMEVG